MKGVCTLVLCALIFLSGVEGVQNSSAGPAEQDGFYFAVTADMRNFAGPGQYDTSQYFRGAVEKMAGIGKAAFMITPGDMDPPDQVRWTIDAVSGPGFRWFPVVGNHELPGAGSESTYGANLAWLRAYDTGAVHPGPSGCPETTYSFDFQNAHFAILNEYCDSGGDAETAGDIPDHLYNWLAADLAGTQQPVIFVVGHAPAYPQPDQDNGRLRHETDSLNQYAEHRDRFWNLLKQYPVVAYLCGHTHNFSAVPVDGIWQGDVGHARGLGDTGAPSTLTLIWVRVTAAGFDIYRDDAQGGAYTLLHHGTLVGLRTFLPIIQTQIFSGVN